MRSMINGLKHAALGGAVLAIACGRSGAEPPETMGILPEQKTPTLISESERNPFGTRTKKEDVAVYDKESEESQIRRIFTQLQVNGMSEARNGFQRVLLGDMILEKGKKVPPLIDRQSETLIVSDITDEQVELSWVDEATMRLDGRKLLIPIALDPTVEFVLKGQPGGDEKRRAVKIFKDDGEPRRGFASASFGSPAIPGNPE